MVAETKVQVLGPLEEVVLAADGGDIAPGEGWWQVGDVAFPEVGVFEGGVGPHKEEDH